MYKKLRKMWIPLLILFGGAFGFSLMSVFSPISNDTFCHDAGIFAHIGNAIIKGDVLYTGAWDNKGPLLYFIDALGIFINYRYGIYVIELIMLFITSLFLYKTGLLFVSRAEALICTFFCMTPLVVTFEGGNLSEEYALPFTVIAFYLIAKFFKNEYILKKYEMMIVGACIAAIFILRLNILAFLAVAVLVVIIVLSVKKDVKTLITVTAFSLIGFFLFLTPFVIYLVETGSLKMCIDTVYLGAVGFFSDISLQTRLENVADMLMSLKVTGTLYMIILFVIVYLHYFIRHRSKLSALDILGLISFFGLAITLIANSISGARHMHYFMCFVPVLMVPAIWLLDKVKKMCNQKYWRRYAIPGLSCVVLVILSLNMYIPLLENMGGLDRWRDRAYFAVEEYVAENTEPDDRIQVFGEENGATAYYRTNRLAASNFFYYANGRFSDEAKTSFADEIAKDVINEKPKLIMFENQEKMDDFLEHITDIEKWDDFVSSEYTVEETDFFYKIYKRN